MAFSDARRIDSNTTIEADLCVVGGGAAGITIAREFAGTGIRLCLLEAGGFAVDEAVDRLSVIDNVGRDHAEHMNADRLRFFGGATNHWGGHCAPLSPDDFEKQDWIPHSGWPYGYDTLRPYYVRAHGLLGLGTFDYDARAVGATLGFDEFPFDSANVVTTVSRYNAVRFGPAYRDMITGGRTMQAILYADVSMIAMEDAASDRVDSVLVGSVAGNQFRVRSKYFVVATGGIENARILLLSNQQRSAGLGNHSDLVGRFFQDHLWYPSGYILPRTGSLAFKYYLDERPYGPIRVRAHIALPADRVRALQIPKFRAQIAPISFAHRNLEKLNEKISIPDVLALVSDPVGLGTLARCGDDAANTAYLLENLVQQTPNPDSRVRLSEKRDPLGRQQPQLDWRLSQVDQEGVVKAQRLIAQEVGRSGFGRMRIELAEGSDDLLETCGGAAHHSGTTRMDDDPAQGVTDGNAKVHYTHNLYVAGSSLFPTCGWANPTLTIVATSIRLADHLKTRLRADGIL